MSRKRKIQIAKIGLLLGILILVSTLALSQATEMGLLRTERTYLLTEQDYGRVNAGEVFIVEYEISLPLKLDIGAIKETFSMDMLDFLEGQHTIYYKDETYEVAIFLNYTHLRIKINSTKVCMMNWNIKMYDDNWNSEEIQGTVIFDRITVRGIEDFLEHDNTSIPMDVFIWNEEMGRWEHADSVVIEWNQEEGRYETTIIPKEDS